MPLKTAIHRQIWPIAAAVAIYGIVFAIQLGQINRYTGGHQLYPLDDVYIHAAVAKNLLLHHVYGVSRYQSSFPSSSILWPFILVIAFAVVGVKAYVPLALNVVFSMLCLWVADRLLTRLSSTIEPTGRFLCLALLVLGVPLLGLSFEGMEHVLHIFATLCLLDCYARMQLDPSLKPRIALALAAACATGVRYESLFVVLMLLLLLLWRRDWAAAALMALGSVAPVVAFGLFAHRHGGTFLPASLLVKTSSAQQLALMGGVIKLFSPYALLSGITLAFVATVVAALCLSLESVREARTVSDLLWVLAGTFLIHAQVAQFGWLFRYEAYLLATSVVLVFAASGFLSRLNSVSFLTSKRSATAIVAVLFVFAFSGRAESMLAGIPRNTAAIYEQQYQTARFLAAYYSNQVIGLNDIGAPDFFADIRCVDLFGLASGEIASLKRSGEFNRAAIERVATERRLRVAILYPELFPNEIPYAWIPVSDMTVTNLPGKVQLGQRHVTFYASDAAEAAKLLSNVEQFRLQLPPGVLITPLPAPHPSMAAGLRNTLR
jgi:hypothetical protein